MSPPPGRPCLRNLFVLGVAASVLACGAGAPSLAEPEALQPAQQPHEDPPDSGADDAGAGSVDGNVADDAGVIPDGGNPSDAGTPSDPNPPAIQVYVNNIENLPLPTDQCRGEWQDLYLYMKTQPSPDLFLVQQVSNQAQLDLLVSHMSATLVGTYAGLIADPSPEGFNSPCGAPKALQTNAIIYRVGRFEPVGAKQTWRTWRISNGECVRDGLARTLSVMQKFRDKLGAREVTVASVHWSTAQEADTDPACAHKNVVELDEKLHQAGFGGDLLLFGGDMNEPDLRTNAVTSAYRPWYAAANGDLGGALNYRDAIYAQCEAAASVKQCLLDNNTTASRIDFLFAQRGDGTLPPTSAAHTITFAEADAAAKSADINYSDHRAVRAKISY